MNNEEKLKEAKRLYQMANFDQRYVLESLFPELKESEDEKIRKTLIEYFNAYPKDYFGGLKKSYIVAWLEKQGKKETLCDKCRKEQPSHSCQDITSLGRCALEKQGEKKPFDYEHANIQQKDYSPEEDEELFFGDFRKTDSEDKGKASFANRQVYNRAILKILSNYVEKYPDIRFGQMLCNLGIGPVFNEESRETYCNLNETINKKS